jgi:hypothetical protein
MVCMITLRKRAGHKLLLLMQPDHHTSLHARPEHFCDITTTPLSLARRVTHLGVDGKKARLLKKPSPHSHGPSPTTMLTIEGIKISTFDKEVSIPPKVLDTMAVSPPLLPPSILCPSQTNH